MPNSERGGTRREIIRDHVYEEFDATRLRMQDYLEHYGVAFLESDTPLGQTEPPAPVDVMKDAQQTVREQNEKLGRELTQDEMLGVWEYHQRRVRNDTVRIEHESDNSLLLISFTLMMIGYNAVLSNRTARNIARAACVKRTIYQYAEARTLPEVWRYMLDNEFAWYDHTNGTVVE